MPGHAALSDPSDQRRLHFETIIGESPEMREVFALVEKIVDSDTTIIITGESGTGKGLVAGAIHRYSRRRNRRFVSINCGAIPENLIASELFGYVRGAFTGATANKSGKFEQADGGSLFLDEIGDMNLEMQVKLLKVLEEKEFEPVGGNKPVKTDVRIIAATHKDLEEEVQNGNFREDLFYRLYVIPVRIPPLRDRISDIPLLIDYFLDLFNRKNHRTVEGVHSEALDRLVAYPWPGNVRELRNVMERIVVLKGGGVILPADLPGRLAAEHDDGPSAANPSADLPDDGICLSTAVNEYEKALILQSLKKTHWVKNQAAKLLQMNRTTLVEKIKRYRLQKPCMGAR